MPNYEKVMKSENEIANSKTMAEVNKQFSCVLGDQEKTTDSKEESKGDPTTASELTQDDTEAQDKSEVEEVVQETES